jgi:ABC-type Mn2+/Zn2+ transport system permease subunit
VVIRGEWLVPALAGSVSLGMVVGALAGWLLLRRAGVAAVGLARPMLVGLAAGMLAGGLGAAGSLLLDEVGLVVAVLGACAVATLCVLVFAAMLRLLSPSLLAQMWALRRRTPSAEVGSS